jgi:hypothetical protein
MKRAARGLKARKTAIKGKRHYAHRGPKTDKKPEKRRKITKSDKNAKNAHIGLGCWASTNCPLATTKLLTF